MTKLDETFDLVVVTTTPGEIACALRSGNGGFGFAIYMGLFTEISLLWYGVFAASITAAAWLPSILTPTQEYAHED